MLVVKTQAKSVRPIRVIGMSLFEDVHSVQGAPALAVLFALFALGSGAVGSLGELITSPAALLVLVVIIGATYGQ